MIQKARYYAQGMTFGVQPSVPSHQQVEDSSRIRFVDGAPSSSKISSGNTESQTLQQSPDHTADRDALTSEET